MLTTRYQPETPGEGRDDDSGREEQHSAEADKQRADRREEHDGHGAALVGGMHIRAAGCRMSHCSVAKTIQVIRFGQRQPLHYITLARDKLKANNGSHRESVKKLGRG